MDVGESSTGIDSGGRSSRPDRVNARCAISFSIRI
jgi:hypothetical protein